MENNHFIHLMLFLIVILTGREKMNLTPLKSLWCDQTYKPIKICMLRMGIRDNDVLSDEYYSQFTDLVIKQLKLVE